MISKTYLPSQSTIKHLRFRFSIYLTPVFFFALCDGVEVSIEKACILFFILTVGIFPASNGYNSYYDKDEESIGGLERPPQVKTDLLYYSLGIEATALLLSYALFSKEIALLLLIYGVFSKLYSHPSIRLKSKPILGFLTVIFFQGPVIFFVTKLACTGSLGDQVFLKGLTSSLFLAASYPLTQIYQYREDTKRGDVTLSRLLGLKGTFMFSGVAFMLSGLLISILWGPSRSTLIFIISSIPGAGFLSVWARKTWSDPQEANFKNTHTFMRLASVGAIGGFVMIFCLNAFAAGREGYSTEQLEGKPWFELQVREDKDLTTVIFKNSKGPLSEENIYFDNGQATRYTWNQFQTAQKIEVKRSGSKLEILEAGQTKKIELSPEERKLLAFPPELYRFLEKGIQQDPKATVLPLYLIAPDKGLVLKFQFKKDKDRVWVLRSESFFVRMVVADILFTLNEKGRIISIRGIVPPVKFPVKSQLENRKTDIVLKDDGL